MQPTFITSTQQHITDHYYPHFFLINFTSLITTFPFKYVLHYYYIYVSALQVNIK